MPLNRNPNRKALPARRPAETATGVAGTVVLVPALVFDVSVDDSVVVAALAGIAAIPAIVTAFVERFRT